MLTYIKKKIRTRSQLLSGNRNCSGVSLVCVFTELKQVQDQRLNDRNKRKLKWNALFWTSFTAGTGRDYSYQARVLLSVFPPVPKTRSISMALQIDVNSFISIYRVISCLVINVLRFVRYKFNVFLLYLWLLVFLLYLLSPHHTVTFSLPLTLFFNFNFHNFPIFLLQTSC